MADPLSISASIAGLVTLVDVLVNRIYKYARGVKNAEKDILTLAKEINLLGGTVNSLVRLSDVLQDPSFDRGFHLHHIESCRDILVEIKRKLDRGLDGGEKVSLKQKLTWPFTNRQVKELLEELSELKNSFNLALSANSLDVLIKLLSKEEAHATEILVEVKETRKITSRIQQDVHRRKILEFFLRYNPQQNYDTSLSLRHRNTGRWLGLLPKYQYWLSTPDSRLWLKGIPGAGKTVLAGYVIESVLQKSTDTKPVAFFFCDYKNERTHDIVTILGALVYQLALQKEEAYTKLEEYYNDLHPAHGLPKSPTVTGLERLLGQMIEMNDHVFLVVDGIDECGDIMSEVSTTLSGIATGTDRVSMALLSRDEIEIRDSLHQDFEAIEIAAHREDIIEYVSSEIGERIQRRKLRIDSPELKEEILDGLVDGAKGMFRWVACQLDQLERCDSDQECRDALKSLPATLDETYARILRRIPKNKVQIVRLVLSCIAVGQDNFDIDQLRQIISVPARGTYLRPESVKREETITRYCSSLIRRSKRGVQDVFEFSHFTVQEFLQNPNTLQGELECFYLSEAESQALIAIEALRFIQLKNFEISWDNIDEGIKQLQLQAAQLSLYKVAMKWPWSMGQIMDNMEFFELAKCFFRPEKTPHLTTWTIALSIRNTIGIIDRVGEDGRKNVWILVDPENARTFVDPAVTPLHIAAACSLPKICHYLLEQGMDVNRTSPLGYPIQCAVQPPEDTFATTRGRPMPLADFDQNHAFDRAREQTLECLQQAGASLAVRRGGSFAGESLFQVAAESALHRSSFAVLISLLRLGIPLDDGDLSTAKNMLSDENLGLGLGMTFPGFAQVLVERRHISAHYQSLFVLAWETAVRRGQDKLFHLTMKDKQSLMEAKDLEQQAILAVEKGHLETLQILASDSPVPLSKIVDDKGDSLLHIALIKPNEQTLAVIKILLAAGCDISLANKQQEQPMHTLCKSDDLPGSKSNVEDSEEDYTPEHNASGEDTSKGDGNDVGGPAKTYAENILGLLTEYGMNCSTKEPHGRNALHLLVSKPTWLKALLKCQPKSSVTEAMETVDNEGYSPLARAIADGCSMSALALATYGPITVASTCSPTPILWLAAELGSLKLFDVLLASDISTPASDSRCPLHFLGPRATVDLVRRLKSLHPLGCGTRVQDETPIDAYMRRCINANPKVSSSINYSAVVEELYDPDTDLCWEHFASYVCLTVKTVYDDAVNWSKIPAFKEVIDPIGSSLIRLGSMASYEQRKRTSGATLFIKRLDSGDQKSILEVSYELYSQVIEHTDYVSEIRFSNNATRLLVEAGRRCDFEFVKTLLNKGVSVHQRGTHGSVLEVCCDYWGDASDDDMLKVLQLLFDHAEPLRLNEWIPERDHLSLLHLVPDCKNAKFLIKGLVQAGADPNVRAGDPNVTPALVHQILAGNVECASALLEMGADPSIADLVGWDAAIAASSQGLHGLLEIISSSERTPNTISWQRTVRATFGPNKTGILYGANALHLGAGAGSIECLSFYLNRNLISDINTRSKNGFTPLHCAAHKGRLNVIDYLVAKGCDVNAKTQKGKSALHLALKHGQTEAVLALARAGCKSSPDDDAAVQQEAEEAPRDLSESSKRDNNAANRAVSAVSEMLDRTALSKAFEDEIRRGNLQRCIKLFENGCAIDAPLTSCGCCSPLILSIRLGMISIFQWLLKEGASATAPTLCMGTPGYRAVHMVVGQRWLAITRALPDALQSYMRDGGTFLGESPSLISTVIQKGTGASLERLLNHLKQNRQHYAHILGRNPDEILHSAVNEIVDRQGTCLHHAVRRGNTRAIEVLIKHGADINSNASAGKNTPLHITIQQESVLSEDIALQLIDAGASLDARNSQGETPLMIATRNRDLPIIQHLIRKGASLTCQDYSSTPVIRFTSEDWRPESAAQHVPLFAHFFQLGLDPHIKPSHRESNFEGMITCSPFISLVLGLDIRLEDSKPMDWASVYSGGAAWLTTSFSLFLRKFGHERLRAFANLEPSVGWSPLCLYASRGEVEALESLLVLGANLEYVGCPEGTALMAACTNGQKECVEYLVRHGAALHCCGRQGNQSAYDAAKGHKSIQRWLLVGRFTDQRKLTSEPANDGCGQTVPWGGPMKVEFVISGRMERMPRESSREYWTRLMREKEKLKGTVLPLGTKRRTIRQSKLVPDESVQVRTDNSAMTKIITEILDLPEDYDSDATSYLSY